MFPLFIHNMTNMNRSPCKIKSLEDMNIQVKTVVNRKDTNMSTIP